MRTGHWHSRESCSKLAVERQRTVNKISWPQEDSANQVVSNAFSYMYNLETDFRKELKGHRQSRDEMKHKIN
jgi:hypothetical protein